MRAVLIEVSTLVMEDGFGRAAMVTILLVTVLVFSPPMLVPIGTYLLGTRDQHRRGRGVDRR